MFILVYVVINIACYFEKNLTRKMPILMNITKTYLAMFFSLFHEYWIIKQLLFE